MTMECGYFTRDNTGCVTLYNWIDAMLCAVNHIASSDDDSSVHQIFIRSTNYHSAVRR